VRLVAVVGVAVLLAGCGGFDRQALVQEVVAHGAPGALAVVRDDGKSWRGASGFAAVGGRVPMRSDLRFRAGSITKSFVAVVVLQLVAEGRIGLDDRVSGFRVRDLLAHTTGIADLAGLPGVTSRHWRPAGLVSAALAEPRVFASPGSRFAYSSTNYVLLGELVERTTGRSLEQEVRDRIIRPLGLRRTGFALADGDVHGYAPPVRDGIVQARPGRDTWHDDPSWAWASGDLVSTADDLARFYAALLGGELVHGPLLSQMLRPAVERPGRLRYGLGVAIIRTPCGLAYGHTGNVLGTVSAVWNDREARRQVVVTANAFPLGVEADQALRNLLERLFCEGR
jgi:D-alanyl-D-alanine carboxypeptidase